MEDFKWMLTYNSHKLDNLADAMESHAGRLAIAAQTPLTPEENRMITNDLWETIAIIRMNTRDVDEWNKPSKKKTWQFWKK